MTTKGGYILLHRRLRSHYLFKREPETERGAWIDLLLQASYTPHRLRWNSEIITVGRGEVPTSYRKLAEQWMWGVNSVRRFLSILEQEGMVSTKTDTGFLIVTICNYDTYQGELINADTPSDTVPDTQADTNINKRKEKKENKSPPSPLSAKQEKAERISNLSSLPFDSLPAEWSEWAHGAMGWDAETIADVWANFRDYWRRKNGKSGLKSDWPAAWRVWCRKEGIRPAKPSASQGNVQRPMSDSDRARSYAFQLRKANVMDASKERWLKAYEEKHGVVVA
jgi:hypothetical protein